MQEAAIANICFFAKNAIYMETGLTVLIGKATTAQALKS